MTLPYCRERSIDFLCDYVDSWIIIIGFFNKDPTLVKDTNMNWINETVLTMTILKQSIKRLQQ